MSSYNKPRGRPKRMNDIVCDWDSRKNCWSIKTSDGYFICDRKSKIFKRVIIIDENDENQDKTQDKTQKKQKTQEETQVNKRPKKIYDFSQVVDLTNSDSEDDDEIPILSRALTNAGVKYPENIPQKNNEKNKPQKNNEKNENNENSPEKNTEKNNENIPQNNENNENQFLTPIKKYWGEYTF